MNLFDGLKGGDKVFVVYQNRRGQTEERSEILPVSRVGRTYGYIERYGAECPFYLLDGISHHKDQNARANKYGFDVYPSEECYRNVMHSKSEMARLKGRIADRYNGLKKLSPDVVQSIHKVLDEAGVP